MKAIIYMRISEWSKPERLTEQKIKCTEAARIHGYDIIGEIQEITNECKSRRMGIMRTKDLIDQGKIDVVLAVNADKIFHKIDDLKNYVEYCDKRGILVFTVEEGLLNTKIHTMTSAKPQPKRFQSMRMM